MIDSLIGRVRARSRNRLLVGLAAAALGLGVVVPAAQAQARAELTPAASSAAHPASISRSAGAVSRAADLAAHPVAQPNRQVTFGLQTSAADKPDGRGQYLVTADAGGMTTDHVAVINYSEIPVTLSLYPTDAYNAEDGGFSLLTADQKPTDLGSWVSLPQTKITLPAKGKKILPFTAKIPKSATPGDHAGAIIGSYLQEGRNAKGERINIEQRVGVRIYLRVSGTVKPSLAVEQVSAQADTIANPFGTTKVHVTYRIHNTGNVRLAAIQAVRITNVFGLARPGAKQKDLEELLPGGSALVKGDVDGVRPAGPMWATVVVDPIPTRNDVNPDVASGGQLSVRTMFWAVPWTALVIVLLLLGGGGTYLWRRIRRRPGRGGGGWADAGSGVPSGPPAAAVADRPTTPARSVADSGQPSRGANPDRRAPRLRRAGSVALAVALGIGLGGVSPSTAAAASPGGTLTFLPSKGMDITPMYMYTSGGCPAGTASTIGFATGNGLTGDGLVVRTPATVGISRDQPFEMPFVDTLGSLAQVAGVKLRAGTYTVTLSCLDSSSSTALRSFVGTLNYSDGKHFTAAAPPKGSFPDSRGRVLAGEIRMPMEEPDPTKITPLPSVTTAPAVPGSAGTSTQAAGAGSTGAFRRAADRTSPFGWVLAGVLALGAATGGVLVLQRRRTRPVEAEAGQEWPDNDPDRTS